MSRRRAGSARAFSRTARRTASSIGKSGVDDSGAQQMGDTSSRTGSAFGIAKVLHVFDISQISSRLPSTGMATTLIVRRSQSFHARNSPAGGKYRGQSASRRSRSVARVLVGSGPLLLGSGIRPPTADQSVGVRSRRAYPRIQKSFIQRDTAAAFSSPLLSQFPPIPLPDASTGVPAFPEMFEPQDFEAVGA